MKNNVWVWVGLTVLVLIPSASDAQVRPARSALEERVRARFAEIVRTDLGLTAEQLQEVMFTPSRPDRQRAVRPNARRHGLSHEILHGCEPQGGEHLLDVIRAWSDVAMGKLWCGIKHVRCLRSRKQGFRRRPCGGQRGFWVHGDDIRSMLRPRARGSQNRRNPDPG